MAVLHDSKGWGEGGASRVILRTSCPGPAKSSCFAWINIYIKHRLQTKEPRGLLAARLIEPYYLTS